MTTTSSGCSLPRMSAITFPELTSPRKRGVSCRYNSFMNNIDAVFEDGVAGTQILPGLKQYRLDPLYNRGNLVFDFRLGYKIVDKYRIGFIINNALNREYEARPGDIQAPRNFVLQLQMNL